METVLESKVEAVVAVEGKFFGIVGSFLAYLI